MRIRKRFTVIVEQYTTPRRTITLQKRIKDPLAAAAAAIKTIYGNNAKWTIDGYQSTIPKLPSIEPYQQILYSQRGHISILKSTQPNISRIIAEARVTVIAAKSIHSGGVDHE